jgi:hypothetical protein
MQHIVRCATHAERGHGLYETPAVAVEALLRVEELPYRIWEPAAGRGAIANVLRAAGHDVVAQDLVNYGVPGQIGGRDFLMEFEPPSDCDTIVTNPPFRIANEFVAHALDLCPRVVMLLRLAFLESERRRPILEGCGLARVHVFRKRLPMMHRDGWEGRKANSGQGFAWFVWNRDYSGPATIHRIVGGEMIDDKDFEDDVTWAAFLIIGTILLIPILVTIRFWWLGW